MKNMIHPFAPLSILILLSTNVPCLAQDAKPNSQSRPTSGPVTPRPTGTTGTTTPATSPGASTRESASTSADYRLVAGDKLRIDIYKDANLSQSLQVRPDGKITMPLLGDVVAAGRTPTELRDAITQSMRQYITEPVVTVIVVETVPGTIYVMGEVKSPGPQALTGQLSVLQAIATAGGFTEFAKTKDVRILRKNPRGGGETTIQFNYKDAINGKMQTMYVQAGDTIIVP